MAYCLTIISLLFSPLIAFAENQSLENWEILSFDDEITINENGQVSITENILADFSKEEHRGVGRDIPYSYSDGLFDYNARLEFLSATDANGNSWANTASKDGRFLSIEMRTLDNMPTNQEMSFVLKYLANNVILSFDEKSAKENETFAHNEFYWNVNGTDWVVPVQKLTALVHLPKELSKDQIKLDCYTGTFGEKNKNCEYEIKDNKTVFFETTKPLQPFENMSILVAMPEGTIQRPVSQSIIWFFADYWGILLAIIVIVGMFSLWYKKGRDDKTVKDTIMPHYKAPKDLSPLETGTIFDEKLDPQDITSVIIDFAVRGFIKIKEVVKDGLFSKSVDYELELIKPYETVKPGEKIILENIFSENKSGSKKLISDLKNKFYRNMRPLEKAVMADLVKNDYFPASPVKIRAIYSTIGIILLFISFQTFAAFNPINGISLIISGLTILIIGRFMPRKTKKGTETFYTLKGLYEYINTAEKDRMKFQEENNILFEKLLPYAMAFGLISKWTKAFDGILKEPPTWYVGSYYWHSHGFSMNAFANSMGHVSTNLTTTITSRPGGSGGGFGGGGGGGFSGGGFGGGGGHGL